MLDALLPGRVSIAQFKNRVIAWITIRMQSRLRNGSQFECSQKQDI